MILPRIIIRMEVTTARTTATITMLIPSLNTMVTFIREEKQKQGIEGTRDYIYITLGKYLANTETISEGTVQLGLTKIW